VRVVEFASESEAAQYAIADNRLTEFNPMSGPEVEAILKEIAEAGEAVEVPGYTEAELQAMLADTAPEESKYTAKITAPVYEPTQPAPPPVSALYDEAKARSLSGRIRAASLPPEVAAFLLAAAARHTVFNYRNIAEFYAHASLEVQALMEESALVIIDFDKAIEGGFIRMTERLAEIAGLEEGDDAP
jgi:hypothetical protein